MQLAVRFRRAAAGSCTTGSAMPGYPGFCVNRKVTLTCAMNGVGAFLCPPHADASVPLERADGAIDQVGAMTLGAPLKGTHPASRLWWYGYPRARGYVEPWTRDGHLRPGLSLVGRVLDGWCVPSSEATGVAALAGRPVLRCLTPRAFEPCFPRSARWKVSGSVVACAEGPGLGRFLRFTITQLR